jgi:hypothetical protein
VSQKNGDELLIFHRQQPEHPGLERTVDFTAAAAAFYPRYLNRLSAKRTTRRQMQLFNFLIHISPISTTSGILINIFDLSIEILGQNQKKVKNIA